MSDSAVWQGMAQVQKHLASIDRRITKERQRLIAGAARKTLVPAIKAEAPAETDPYSKRTMKSVVSARNGREGAVLVGPKGGKAGVWFRHITVGGAKAHEIGGPKAATRRRRTARGRLGRLFRNRRRPQPVEVVQFAEQVVDAVGKYVIGQGTQGLANGVFSFIAMSIIGAEYPALFALIALAALVASW